MLGEHVCALTIPLALGDANLLLSVHVACRDAVAGNREHGNLSGRTFKLGLNVLLLVDVDHSHVDVAVLAQRGADVQPGSVLDAAHPLGRGLTLVDTASDVRADGPAAHVAREEIQRPPGGLLDDAVLGRHQGGDDIDGLSDAGHADVFALADKDVQVHGHGQGIGECVGLLSALAALGANGVPNVPLVEADSGTKLVRGNAVLDPRKIDQGGGDFNGALCGQGGGGIGQVGRG